ncbi:hypothetical protein COD07_19230 [Bacillus thuringiensis]|nr:hypothetical protein COD07_19230 [Bacillus thuringiensis]
MVLLNNNKFKNRVKVNNKYFNDKNNLLNYLNGYRSFLISWLNNNASSIEYKKQKKYIKRLEKVIEYISKIS